MVTARRTSPSPMPGLAPATEELHGLQPMRYHAPFLSRQWLSGRPGFLNIAAILIAAGNLAAQVSTSLVLSSSANPSIPGQDITLTATVSPATITGKVTFYDGTTVLGTGVLTNGKAALSTGLLASGVRSLRALYPGNAIGAASAGVFTLARFFTRPLRIS